MEHRNHKYLHAYGKESDTGIFILTNEFPKYESKENIWIEEHNIVISISHFSNEICTRKPAIFIDLGHTIHCKKKVVSFLTKLN